MPLPGPVQELCDRFLSLAPHDLVTGLYLTGGIGFGEWVDGKSDVDFVATLAHRRDDDQVRDAADFTTYVVERGTGRPVVPSAD